MGGQLCVNSIFGVLRHYGCLVGILYLHCTLSGMECLRTLEPRPTIVSL